MPAHAQLKEETNMPEIPIWHPEPLPTMYDLPSEDPEEPGLPDEFHCYQPQLLRETFCPPNYPLEKIFIATDLNLYYDSQHTSWYKRPDWFAVLGVPSSYGEQHDMRYSYVIWDEKIVPFIVVELLSESTKDEDLGKTLREIKQPPTKWQVYEQNLKIPYYVVFSRQTGEWQVFQLQGKHYHQLVIENERLWLPKIQLGLGLWSGTYSNFEHLWLRWYDENGWIPTAQENFEAEQQRVKKEQQRVKEEQQRANVAEQRANSAFENGEQTKAFETARKMLAKGYSLAEIMDLTGLSPAALTTV